MTDPRRDVFELVDRLREAATDLEPHAQRGRIVFRPEEIRADLAAAADHLERLLRLEGAVLILRDDEGGWARPARAVVLPGVDVDFPQYAPPAAAADQPFMATPWSDVPTP